MIGIVESRSMVLMLLALLLLLLMLSSAVFSAMISVFVCYKVLLLYCWRVFSFRFFFCCEIGWAIDKVDCDCDCGCGAGGADVVGADDKMGYAGAGLGDLASKAFSLVVMFFIIFINWSIFAFIDNEAPCFSVSFSWFRVDMISTGLMKESIIASTVDINMPFKRFFWSRWIR